MRLSLLVLYVPEPTLDRAFALPEKTKDGKGWWVTDPIGNTVVLLRGA